MLVKNNLAFQGGMSTKSSRFARQNSQSVAESNLQEDSVNFGSSKTAGMKLTKLFGGLAVISILAIPTVNYVSTAVKNYKDFNELHEKALKVDDDGAAVRQLQEAMGTYDNELAQERLKYFKKEINDKLAKKTADSLATAQKALKTVK